jgi:uncharacterized protein DUF3500
MSAVRRCPDCDAADFPLSRRELLKAAGAAAALTASPRLLLAEDKPVGNPPETLVKQLFDSLSDAQKKEVCFAWDYQDPQRGLLRTRISNNWQITKPHIKSDFFTTDQQAIVRGIYEGVINPGWIERVDQQLKDDTGGKEWGAEQSLAIFGMPGEKFELVMTGRHMTVRCDGNSAEHVAFGGPIFYGHAASGFNEKPGHPDNVYWEQALEANKVFELLDGKQREKASVPKLPKEEAVGFQGISGVLPGIPISELSSDQKEQVQKTLAKLLDHYRQADQQEVQSCLEAQGGLDKCALAFYTDKEADLGADQVWDCWRLEGPSFVWYFRGVPHVHVWVHVADDASVKLNA